MIMMKKIFSLFLFLVLLTTSAKAQQIIYDSLDDLLEEKGDTVTTLRVEKRTKNLIYLYGGVDYRITVDENHSMSRYLKMRCYAVRVDSTLYLNCKKIRYGRYRFGYWYAQAFERGGRIFFSAQPLGQVATSHTLPLDVNKLGGEIGDAINASGLVEERVYYELNVKTGKAEFVGLDYLKQLFKEDAAVLKKLSEEKSEKASVVRKYLELLK